MPTVDQRADILGTEGARRATGVSRISQAAIDRPSRPVASPVEVNDKPTRRRFSAEYKLRILKQADACKDPGSLGALLRREGLYHSSLSLWRRQREEGVLSVLGKKPGRKGPGVNALVLENRKLRKENEELQKKLRQAELIIDVQKKISQVLQIPLENVEDDENS